MEFECTINRKSAKEIYKKTGKNVGITIIKIIFCFLAICLFHFFADKRYCDDLTVGRFLDSNGDIFNHLLSKTT